MYISRFLIDPQVHSQHGFSPPFETGSLISSSSDGKDINRQARLSKAVCQEFPAKLTSSFSRFNESNGSIICAERTAAPSTCVIRSIACTTTPFAPRWHARSRYPYGQHPRLDRTIFHLRQHAACLHSPRPIPHSRLPLVSSRRRERATALKSA